MGSFKLDQQATLRRRFSGGGKGRKRPGGGYPCPCPAILPLRTKPHSSILLILLFLIGMTTLHLTTDAPRWAIDLSFTGAGDVFRVTALSLGRSGRLVT